MRDWGTGATIGAMYRVRDTRQLSRVGHCWMAGRLKVGDLLLCVGHSGDCFFNYILVEECANGLKGIPESRFGAYVLGELIPLRPTAREFHLLAAGEFVPLELSPAVDAVDPHATNQPEPSTRA
jgi:hypothetical protein